MIIESLTMRNFRLFEEAHIDFHDRVSVVVGVNGAGKSSVLDAMSILLSCYVGGFDGFAARRIAQSDIRHVTHKIGSFYENVPQLPVEVSATGSICSERVSWGSLKLKDSPQSSSPSAYDELTRVAAEHQAPPTRGRRVARTAPCRLLRHRAPVEARSLEKAVRGQAQRAV